MTDQANGGSAGAAPHRGSPRNPDGDDRLFVLRWRIGIRAEPGGFIDPLCRYCGGESRFGARVLLLCRPAVQTSHGRCRPSRFAVN